MEINLFTLFFLCHTPAAYGKLRQACFEQTRERYYSDPTNKKWWEDNPKRAHDMVLKYQEADYPTPQRFHDLAGYIDIGIEIAVEGIRVIGTVWSIPNRNFSRNKAFKWCHYAPPGKLIAKTMAEHEIDRKFIGYAKEIVQETEENYLRRKKFYLDYVANSVNWKLVEQFSLARFLNDQQNT